MKEGKGNTSRGTDRNVQTNICLFFAWTLSRGYVGILSPSESWTVHIERSDGCGGTGDELNDELKPRRFTIRSVPASSADGFPGPRRRPDERGAR